VTGAVTTRSILSFCTLHAYKSLTDTCSGCADLVFGGRGACQSLMFYVTYMYRAGRRIRNRLNETNLKLSPVTLSNDKNSIKVVIE
jgi:hypothetical protein